MAKAKVTIKKDLVCYFAAITQDVKKEVVNTTDEPTTTDDTDPVPDTDPTPDTPVEPVYETVSETKYYKFETNDEDYSPFIEYDETLWEEVDKENVPETLFQIKTVKVPFVDEETEEEKIIVYEYFYILQEKEIEVDKYVKGICTSCLYCVETSRYWRRRYECSHPNHIIENFINGMNMNGDCRDFNMHGECRLYKSILEDEINPDDTPEDVPDDSGNTTPGEDTSDIPSGEDTTTDEILNEGDLGD